MEVDPKLFVTCRLCLEDLGQYQIVPSVQQQIKYCFDIEVEPFDGLPQLICMKCKDNLNKFHTVKKTYCEKQANLRNKVLKKDEIFCIQQQQDTVSSSQQAPETVEPEQPTNQTTDEQCNSKKKHSKRKRLLLHVTSSSDLESEQSFQTSKSQKKKSSRKRGKISMPWEVDYKKLIACKLCNSIWPNRKSLVIHNRSHELLKDRYQNIFNRQCTVNLTKIDNKPNITGLSDMVVHSSNKIVAPGNSYFYTIYSKDHDSADHSESNFLQNKDESQRLSQESSDEEERIAFKPTQRKRRLMSRSSNETVVIESNKLLSDEEDSKSIVRNSIETPLNNGQCINIDDSSDSESDQGKLEKNGKVKQPIEAKLGDYKIIQGIISMCVNSYLKKNDSGEVDMLNVNQNKKKDNVQTSNESQLKHKLLSIGRKIINKQGFSCTGLLRYMEHKNLEIVWMTKAPSSHPKDTNYIRILTKLRGDLNLDDDPGWVNISKMPQSESSNSVPLNDPIIVAVPSKTLCNDPVITEHPQAAKIAISQLKPNIEASQSVNQIHNQAQLDAMPAMLSFVDSKASTSDSKKLLNANPVANPKKLPKKIGIESRSNKTVAKQSIAQTTNDDTNFCLPIITSTTSLATIPSKEQTQDANKKNSATSEETNNTETPAAPRIKVKPASELMSERALDIMKEQATTVTSSNMFVSQIPNAWPQQHAINVFVPNIGPQLLVTTPPLQILQIPNRNTETAYQPMPGPIASNTKNECIILDTTAFPNTKTISPIKYVKDLLQLHNIFLLDPNEIVPNNFICLIKFKVVFKQDHQKDPPVVLCLSLLCCKNQFCFQVRDKNQEIVDLSQISANWQWEVLQTYRGDVSNKVLQNARKFGQELYDLTNHFFCLLKSINCRKRLS